MEFLQVDFRILFLGRECDVLGRSGRVTARELTRNTSTLMSDELQLVYVSS
jgi:hypothetical protein